MAQTTLTRRQWAGALAAAPAALVPVAAAAPQAPADAPPADALLAQARQTVVRNRETLAKFKIDRAVEPATRFEA